MKLERSWEAVSKKAQGARGKKQVGKGQEASQFRLSFQLIGAFVIFQSIGRTPYMFPSCHLPLANLPLAFYEPP